MDLSRLPNPYTGEAGQICQKQVSPRVGDHGYVYNNIGPIADPAVPNTYGFTLSDGLFYRAHITVPGGTTEEFDSLDYRTKHERNFHFKHFHITLDRPAIHWRFHYLTHMARPQTYVAFYWRDRKTYSFSNWGKLPAPADKIPLDATATHFMQQVV